MVKWSQEIFISTGASQMEEEVWYLTDDFNKLPAKYVLKNIIKDDKGNFDRAESELAEDIGLLDDAIVLYIEALQVAYRFMDKWKDNKSTQAAIAMLVSTLNYILLARHSVLLGYYPEVRDLLRSCYERISRCYLFFHDGEFASIFLSDGQINQSTVDKELSEMEQDISKRDEVHKSLREYYKFMSDVAHPNLKSFKARYGSENLGERVGLQYVFGGFMSEKHGHVSIIRVLQTVLSALKILGIIIHDESGSWDKEYQQISKKCNEMVDTL